MSDGVIDRRKTQRIATRALVEVKVPNWQALEKVYTVNLSLGGMRLSMATPPPLGTAIDIILTLPNGQRLHLPGLVAHLGADGTGDVGVRFENLQPRTREEITLYINELIAAPAAPLQAASTGIPSGVLIKKSS